MNRKITKIETIGKLPARKRVAAYARVSCGKEEMLHSLAAQVSHYSEYIQNHREWAYVGVYADEAESGTKDTRPEFQRLIYDCRAGKIDIVLTKSISRFARNTVTLLETVRELKDLNIGVFFEEQNISTLSGDGELMLTILASYAQEESRSVSENCKWRIQKKMKEGKPVGFFGMYGYDYENGEITVNEKQAGVLCSMLEWYINGLGNTAIANRLNEQGIPAHMGGKWLPSRVGAVLANEKLTGNSLLQKKYCDNHLTKKQIRNKGQKPRYFAESTHPSIISAEIFESVARLRQERAAHFNVKDSSQAKYPFSGKILCEHCGRKYKRKKGVGRFYWQCSTYLQEGRAFCPAKQIPEETLMAVTAEVLGLSEFDETVYKDKISEIRVPCSNKLTFVFYDGKMMNREWQDHSRRESWTDEMKAAAREKTKEARQNG